MTTRAKINAALGAICLLLIVLDEALGLGFSEKLELALYGMLAWVMPSPGRVADRRGPQPPTPPLPSEVDTEAGTPDEQDDKPTDRIEVPRR